MTSSRPLSVYIPSERLDTRYSLHDKVCQAFLSIVEENLQQNQVCVDICVKVETLVVEVVESRPKHRDVAKQ
jgi:hypothetical protein